MKKTKAKIIGEWPIEGYRFTDSDGYDGKMFFGLALDEDRQPELAHQAGDLPPELGGRLEGVRLGDGGGEVVDHIPE